MRPTRSSYGGSLDIDTVNLSNFSSTLCSKIQVDSLRVVRIICVNLRVLIMALEVQS